MLFDLLPLLDAWEYKLHEVPVQTLPAGGIHDIVFAEKELGWARSAHIGVQGANAEKTNISIRVDGSLLSMTFEELFLSGQVQRGIVTPYISRYDTVLNIYQGYLEFPYHTPYKTFFRISLTGPSANAIQISGKVATIRIKPEPPNMREMFEKSLRRVLGTAPPAKIIPPR